MSKLDKYKRLLISAKILLSIIFLFSTVSVSFTYAFCPSMNGRESVEKNCCDRDNELSSKEDNSCIMQTKTMPGGSRLAKDNKCCCSITNFIPTFTSESINNIPLNGFKVFTESVSFTMPNVNTNITSKSFSIRDNLPNQGRSIYVLVSNYQI